MKVDPETLLDLAEACEIILDFDKEGICFHIQNEALIVDGLIDLISEHQDAVKACWLTRL